MALDFYHGHGSPYSWRVWLALELKHAPYELKVLSFQSQDTKKPEFAAINPRHVVPTVVDEGYVLWESTVILEYLDERFAAGPRLFPGDAQSRARVRRLVREIEEYLNLEGIGAITTEYFGKEGAAPDLQRVEKAQARVGEELRYLAGELRGKFLAGDEPSAADVVLYPWIGYVKRITVRRPETRLVETIPPAMMEWAKRIETMAFFDKTFPPHWK